MKLTKDEAAVLCQALNIAKYELNEKVLDHARSLGISSMRAFDDLETRLNDFSNDKRRTGRKSQNSFTDILKRFISKL